MRRFRPLQEVQAQEAIPGEEAMDLGLPAKDDEDSPPSPPSPGTAHDSQLLLESEELVEIRERLPLPADGQVTE